MNAKNSLWGGALAAIGASLCCVAPLALVTLGIGGAWIASLASLEPYRPAFVVLTLGLLGQAWIKLYRQPVVCAPSMACADTTVRRRQHMIFWFIAVPLLLLLAFPWYASLFY